MFLILEKRRPNYNMQLKQLKEKNDEYNYKSKKFLHGKTFISKFKIQINQGKYLLFQSYKKQTTIVSSASTNKKRTPTTIENEQGT